MNLSSLPEELRNDPRVKEVADNLEKTFYQLLVESGKTMTTGLSEFGVTSTNIPGMIFKSLTANLCKSAFDSAYVKYVSNGVMKE